MLARPMQGISPVEQKPPLQKAVATPQPITPAGNTGVVPPGNYNPNARDAALRTLGSQMAAAPTPKKNPGARVAPNPNAEFDAEYARLDAQDAKAAAPVPQVAPDALEAKRIKRMRASRLGLPY